MKFKQPCPGFELVSPFLTMIPLHHTPPNKNIIQNAIIKPKGGATMMTMFGYVLQMPRGSPAWKSLKFAVIGSNGTWAKRGGTIAQTW